MSAQKIARAVGEYLGSERVISTVKEFLGKKAISELNTSKYILSGLRIKVQTDWNWLNRKGLHYYTVSKNVYIDGHERKDIVKYRQNDFLPIWTRLEHHMVVFSENGT